MTQKDQNDLSGGLSEVRVKVTRCCPSMCHWAYKPLETTLLRLTLFFYFLPLPVETALIRSATRHFISPNMLQQNSILLICLRLPSFSSCVFHPPVVFLSSSFFVVLFLSQLLLCFLVPCSPYPPLKPPHGLSLSRQRGF